MINDSSNFFAQVVKQIRPRTLSNINMVIIGDLPHEIRLQIINHLYREDLINFSLACKNFHYWAGEPLHEHRQLLQQWTIVSNRGKSGGYLASLVVEHLADARLSDYVEKLDITLNEPLAVNQGSGIDKTSYMAEAIGDSARFLWEEYGSRKIWEKWKSAVEEGDGAYIPQAWWLGLPKINSLTLSLEDSKLDALLEFLEPMYDETGEWFHIDCLDQLQRIQLQARHTPPRAEQAYRLLECCARIPSVTSLSAEHLDMNMSPPCPAFLVVFGSYVEFFRLECCTLGTSHSISLLSSMHKLEHFRCIDVTLDFHPDADGDRAAILTSLESAGKHTLRSLYIKREAITNADRNLLLGYLERFEVLQFVTLDLDVLLHGYERIWELPPGTIRTGMPSALRRLKLVDI